MGSRFYFAIPASFEPPSSLIGDQSVGYAGDPVFKSKRERRRLSITAPASRIFRSAQPSKIGNNTPLSSNKSGTADVNSSSETATGRAFDHKMLAEILPAESSQTVAETSPRSQPRRTPSNNSHFLATRSYHSDHRASASPTSDPRESYGHRGVVSKLNQARSLKSGSLSPRNNSINLSLPIFEFAIDKSIGSSSSTETTKHEISPCLSIEPLHVLIADDSVIARKMVERVLVSTIGAVVSHASNGYEAIDLITQAMKNVSNGQHTAKQNHIEEDDDAKAAILWDEVRGSITPPGGGLGPEQYVADTDNEPDAVLNQSIENWMHSTNLDLSIASTPSSVNDRSTPDKQNFQSLNDSNPFHPPVVDVILMDYHMPGMDGPETIARLRSLGYDGCILALSAIVDAVDRRALLNAGANGVLQKPFRVELFIDTVYGTPETIFVIVAV